MDNEKLNKERSEHGELEKRQLALLRKYDIEKQRRFDVSLSSDALLHIQFLNDLQINSEKLTEWHGKAKNDTQRKQLLSMLKALWRIQTYSENLRTLSKTSVAEYLMEREMHHKAIHEVQQLKKENEILKAEIQHYVDEEEERRT